MMYPFTRPLATIALSTFYRKVYLVHADRIPKDKPVLLAVNHPTAFIEPCILACWLDFPLHFMVRGDLFAKPFFNWLLRDYHMIPIYRMKDGGFSQIKRNFSTMAEAMEVLKSGKAIMMLVEGGTGAPNRLRPLQKGAARLALSTLEHFPDSDVQIVPIGVNYSESNTFRSLVMLEVGHPIPAGEYLNAYRENPNQGIRDLTRAVRQGLLPCVIHVESEEDEQTAGQLLEMVRNDHPLVRSPFAAEKKVANWINDLDQEDKDEIADQVKTYQEKLAGYKLTDRVVAGDQQAGLGWVLWVVMGSVLFFIGYLVNFPPVWLGHYLVRTKVRRKAYQSSIQLAATIFAYLIYIPLLLFAGLLVFGWWGLLVPVLVLLLGVVAVRWYDAWQRMRDLIRWRRLTLAQRQDIRSARQILLKKLDESAMNT